MHLCDSMLGNDNPRYEYHENQMRQMLKLSENDDCMYRMNAAFKFEIEYMDAFKFLSALSYSTKKAVKEIFSYARKNSNLCDARSRDGLQYISDEINNILAL